MIKLSFQWLMICLVAADKLLGQPEQQKVVIDTDPGIDDAVAILVAMAQTNIKVLSVTCVRGNSDISNEVINIHRVLQTANISHVKVHSGNNFALLSTPVYDKWFGEDGFGDLLDLPKPPIIHVQKEHAGSYLANIVRKYPGQVTVLALGPLTNLAIAIHLNPSFLKQAKRVIVMGGSIKGNGDIVPGVEFNFFMDPDAAFWVLDRAVASNISLTLIPFDLGMEHDLTLDWRWNTLAKIENPVVAFLNKLEGKMREWRKWPLYGPLDLLAMSIFLWEECVTKTQDLHGFVENKAHYIRGALVMDYFNVTKKPANFKVVLDVDNEIIKKKVFESLSRYS